LTQLSNRRGFLALSQHALNVCKRLKIPSSLFYIDLDGFKEINDRYGHAEGDRALTCFSDLLRHSCRESDVVGRLGGDEFAVYLIDADEAQSEAHLKRLQSVVAEYNAQNNHVYDLNYSAGLIPCHPEKHSTVADLLEAADELMYGQKMQKETRAEGN
jgi:diguanylate cyclase (GGDEF)-like protein